mmetsp:Transcript_15206/g.59442  ORF Transcript_15206/g.59442 Transcript_15206/m.59442 type:complete len:205 (-) Transcript_15206:562-1176(-)
MKRSAPPPGPLSDGVLEPRALLKHPPQSLPLLLGVLAGRLPHRPVHVVRAVRVRVVPESGVGEELVLVVCVEGLDPARTPPREEHLRVDRPRVARHRQHLRQPPRSRRRQLRAPGFHREVVVIAELVVGAELNRAAYALVELKREELHHRLAVAVGVVGRELLFGVDVVEVDVRELRDGRDVEDSDVLVVFRLVVARSGGGQTG